MIRSDAEVPSRNPLTEPCLPDIPKLAVIISCYNYELFVGHAIRSVLDQRCYDCEVVVVDDGSTDGSWDVISRSGVTAFRIDNSGQLAACLFGLDRTRAPFVLFLDADDELKPGALDTIIDLLDPDIAKLQFALTWIDADGNRIGGTRSSFEAFRSRDELARRVLKSGVYKTPPTSGNVFRRDLCEFLREVDYDRALDGVILFAAPLLGDVVSVSEELGCYRIHGRNDSGLGRMPDVSSLQRDIHRFVARMKHLREIIRRLEPNQKLVDPGDAYYFRERNFYLEIASGRRPRLTSLPGLLSKLADEPFSAKNKVAMAVFFLLATILPNASGKALLAYRLKTGHRSLLGFAKEIVGGEVNSGSEPTCT
jgi:glycosyltransferase involved in cell wall biosynthesis